MACAAFSYSVMQVFAKLMMMEQLSAFSLLFSRSVVGFVLNGLGWLLKRAYQHRTKESEPEDAVVTEPLTRNKVIWLIVRSVTGFASVTLEYKALQYLPLEVMLTIFYSSPIFVVLWSHCLLGEPIKKTGLVCISVCIVGLVVEIQPWKIEDVSFPKWAFLLPLAAAMSSGLLYTSLRALEGVSVFIVLNSCFFSAMGLSALTGGVLGELSFPSTLQAWGFLFGIGSLGYAGEICETKGFAKAGKYTGSVAVFKFLTPIFSILWDFVFFRNEITWIQLVGMVLILGSSGFMVFLMRRQHNEGVRKSSSNLEYLEDVVPREEKMNMSSFFQKNSIKGECKELDYSSEYVVDCSGQEVDCSKQDVFDESSDQIVQIPVHLEL